MESNKHETTATDSRLSSEAESESLTDGLCFSIPKNQEPTIRVHQHKDAFYYNMSQAKRGLAVIFNHETFASNLNLENRSGSPIDRNNLAKTFEDLNFQVVIHNDLDDTEVQSVLKTLAKRNFEDYDCLLIAILSYGEEGGFVYARNAYYSVPALFDRFTPKKCPSLAGKPKLFIVQACPKPTATSQGDGYDHIDSGVLSSTYRIPSNVDFLLACSTIPGSFSWTEPSRGSWFVGAFCEQMNEHWKERDLLTILTFVNRKVASYFGSYDPEKRGQTCTFTSQLTHVLKFCPETVDG